MQKAQRQKEFEGAKIIKTARIVFPLAILVLAIIGAGFYFFSKLEEAKASPQTETLRPNGAGSETSIIGQEILEQRTYNQKVYDLGDGKKNYKIHTAQIHYKDAQGQFQNIDATLSFDDSKKVWQSNKASYHPTIPEYADAWFEFYNAYEEVNHIIKEKPVVSHIKGEYFKEADGSQGVIYKDAFGKGIDLKVYAYWGGIKKVISINKKPADVSKDLTFEFELQLPQGKDKVKDKEGNIWDKSSALNFKDKTIKIGDDGKESYFRNAKVWDSNKLNQPVDIELYTKGDKVYLRKTVTAEILQKAVYPLYTDHPASYYAGAVDGDVGSINANWDTCHDATTGTFASYASTPALSLVGINASNNYLIRRTFLPIDTSGIDDDATISAATLNLYISFIENYDNDGDDWYNVVQTSQASPTALTTADFDQCGAINNPTEGATRIDTGNLTTSAYNSWTLNASGSGSGIDWIKKTAGDPYTMLGLREGHDCIDSTPVLSAGTFNKFEFSSSEYTGTSQDPYLDVTTTAAGSTPIIGTGIKIGNGIKIQ